MGNLLNKENKEKLENKLFDLFIFVNSNDCYVNFERGN